MRAARIALSALFALTMIEMPPAPASDRGGPGGGPQGGPPLDPAPAAGHIGHLRSWTGEPTGVAGEDWFDDGEIIVLDHPFDDRGADTDGDDGRTLSPGEHDTLLKGANAALGSSGDYLYPSDAVYANNAADIVEVRLARDGSRWHLLVVLNALIDPERTAIEARVGSHVVLAHGSTATLDATPVATAADAAANTFEIAVPRSLYDPGDTFRIFVAAGLWDTAAGTWLDPDPAAAGAPYFDLARVPAGDLDSYWHEKEQSRDIAAATFDGDTIPVDFACAEGIVACGFVRAGGLPRTRVFRSAQPLGEGVSPQTRYDQDASAFGWRLYRSPYQPYTIYEAPPRHPGPRPLVLLLHFLGGNHRSYVLTSWPGIKRWADALGAVVAMPLGRGEAGWYEAEAEKDVFEVWRDVAGHYPIDRDRVYLMGMSMGGFGTWRLSQLYPDQFAAGVIWSGPVTPYSIWPAPAPLTVPQANPPQCERDEPGCGYTLTDLFGNSSNVPLLVVHGGADELVPSSGAELWMNDYDQVEAPYRYVFYPGRRHETTYPGTTGHFVEEFLLGLPRRVASPDRVSYRVLRDFQQPDVGIGYDGAYWVDGMTLAAGASEGSIVAERAQPSTSPVEPRIGADLLGPYRISGRETSAPALGGGKLVVEAAGLSRATIDTATMGWDPNAGHRVTGSTDTLLTLTLRGAFPAGLDVLEAAFSGGAGTVTRDGSDIVLEIPPGIFTVRFAPAD